MNVLITGGAGYIGLELVYELATRPFVDKILIYDRLNRNNYNMFTGERKLTGASVELIEDDILNNRSLQAAIDECEVIFHCAAQTPIRSFVGASHIFEQNNHWGSSVLVDCVQFCSSPKYVINLSTLAVFGDVEIVSLDQQPNPSDYYGISKLRAERQLERLTASECHKVLNVRSPIIFGYSKNLRVDQFINRMIFDAKMRGRVQIFGNNTAATPHIYLKNLVSFLISCIHKNFENFTVVPDVQNLSPAEVLNELEIQLPDLETVFVDQGAYTSNLQLNMDVKTENTPDVRNLLSRQISEFLGSFII